MIKHIIKLSEKTVNHMKEFNNHCPTKYIVEDVAKYLSIECDYFTTSLQDLGIKKGYVDLYKFNIEIYI
jgi:hypothetical protein